MPKKKKKSGPSARELLKLWDPEYDQNELEMILYNYQPTKNGYRRVKGIVLLYPKELLIYEDGQRIDRISLQGVESVSLQVSGAAAHIVLQRAGERRRIAAADLSYKKRFGSYVQALNNYLESGTYKKSTTTGGTCPRCGKRYSPGSNRCAYCGGRKKQIAFLGTMLKPLLPMLVLSIVLYIGISLVALIPPVLSEKMVDAYLKNENADSAMVTPYLLAVGAMLLCIFVTRLLSAFRSIVSAKMGCKASLKLRDEVFEKVQKLSLEGIHKRTVGELMKRISEDSAVIRNFLVSDLGELIEIITTFLAIAVILVVYDAKQNSFLFLFIFLPAIPCALLFYFFHKRVRKIYHTQWKLESKAGSLMHDIFSGIRVVKSFGREEAEIARYDRAVSEIKQIQKRNELFWSIFSPILNYLMSIGEFFLLFFVGNKILGGSMTLGEMTKLTAYASMIYTPLRSLAFIPRRIYSTVTSLNKIYDVMEDPNVLSQDEHPIQKDIAGKVQLKNVSFSYEAGKQVLRHIDLEVHPGEMIGLVGRSGAGKTTLVNLIMRLYDADDGQVLLDDVDIRALSSQSLRSSVGAVLQETFLFSGSIRDNIAYAKPDATGEEIIAAAKIAGAHDFIMKMQDGYNTQVGEKGNTLSGGERQRIAIARALLLDPKILILDEATSALDTETEKLIQDAIQKLISGRTTIAIAHRLSTLRNATRIVVLDDKGIAEIGTHEELMRNPGGIYFGLVMAQRSMSSKR